MNSLLIYLFLLALGQAYGSCFGEMHVVQRRLEKQIHILEHSELGQILQDGRLDKFISVGSPYQISKIHSGSNGMIYLARPKEGGAALILKSPDGSQSLEDLFLFGEKGHRLVKREVLNYEFDQLLGLNVVAPTRAVVTEKGGIYSAQDFLEDGFKTLDKASSTALEKANPKDVQKSVLLDFLLGQSDRTSTNWMIDQNGNIRLIDNSMSLPGLRVSFLNTNSHLHYFKGIIKQGIDPSLRELFQSLNENQMIQFLSNYKLSDRAIDAAIFRLNMVKKLLREEPDHALEIIAKINSGQKLKLFLGGSAALIGTYVIYNKFEK